MSHENPNYEYKTQLVPHNSDISTAPKKFDAEMNKEGWARIFADFDIGGVFLVYRRARNAKVGP